MVRAEEIKVGVLIWLAGPCCPCVVSEVDSTSREFKATSFENFEECEFHFSQVDGDSEICTPVRAIQYLAERLNETEGELSGLRREVAALEDDESKIVSAIGTISKLLS
ncbi:MAG: hypothetical protein WCX12_00490 [Candidatus Paceibacterota bacterium]|jgi:hypothetical protein